MEIQLDDIHTCQVKEIDELTSGDQDAVMGAMEVSQDPETGRTIMAGDFSSRMRKALARRIITGWTLQHALPLKRPDSLDKLTLTQKKNLYAGIEGHYKVCAEIPDNPDEPGTDPTSDSGFSSDT